MNAPLSGAWLDALSLAQRGAPDFFRAGDEIADVPHAAAMRQAIREMGVSAIHCIQGVPTIAFAVFTDEDAARIDRLHADLWNQGLMTLLLVIAGDRLLAYTLTRKPVDPERRSGISGSADRRLLETFGLLEHALELRDLVSGVESGRLFRDRYPSALDAGERVDAVLLDNLMDSHRLLLAANLDEDASQALLMQVMFIAYLEDRGVVTADYFREATGLAAVDGLRVLLRTRRPELLRRLFLPLHEHFNGDLFHSPCAFGGEATTCALTSEHLGILEEFIWGEWELGRKQKRFWSYRFRYIPVELVSAVYDRMLAEDAKRKKADGAYYTPTFLADLVVDQAWELLSEAQRHAPEILDPACGSGVFLVRLFERMVEHRRSRSGGKLPWHSLKALLVRLHGWDKNPMAVRIAVFSLYLALLEQREPREIRLLMAEGKLLPPLWGRNLQAVDFFGQAPQRRFDLIVGNPPWNSRKHKLPEAISWCEANGFPIPQEQSAWGFVWKARAHAREEGAIAFLLPAMGFLHNDSAIAPRNRWLIESEVKRIVNFADIRFLLFDGAVPPAALAIYRPTRSGAENYSIEYWTPKADLNVMAKRVLSVCQADKSRSRVATVVTNPDFFKNRMLMGSAESRLFEYLGSHRRLGEVLHPFGTSAAFADQQGPAGWQIGEGFVQAQERRLAEKEYRTYTCQQITELPFLPVSQFRSLVLPLVKNPPWPTATVYRRGFIDGFYGPHILMPHGINPAHGRLRAAYSEQSLCFFHSIRAIKVPPADTDKAKLLTAILNSKLAAWFLLHDTAGFLGAERPRSLEGDVLGLPFPDAQDMELPDESAVAMQRIVSLMNEALARPESPFDEYVLERTLESLDPLVFAYFGLHEEEIALVDETFEEIIPAVQPGRGDRPALWNDSSEADKTRYLRELETSLAAWMQPGTSLHAELLAESSDAAIVRVHLGDAMPDNLPRENWNAVLDRLWPQLDRRVSRNLQVIATLRLFDGDDLYLFKPRKRRFWLRTAAMNDADSIAGELLAEPEESTR